MENRSKRIQAAYENMVVGDITPPPSELNSFFYLNGFKRGESPTVITVTPEDSLECAKRLQKEGYYPLVLNMACETNPGGGWLNGSGAQEETLFYRTDYWRTLDYNLYPLKGPKAIISEHVNVLRDDNLDLLDVKKRWTSSFVAVSAIKNPRRKGKDGMIDEDYYITKAKIELIFRMGIRYRYDSLVLSAFGCGAYNNPPNIIINIFNEMLEKYNGYFKVINFAIIPLERESRMYSGEITKCNYTLFRDKIRTDIDFEKNYDISKIYVKSYTAPKKDPKINPIRKILKRFI